MEIRMDKRIILKIIQNNPHVLQLDVEEIQKLFNEECYKKLEKISDVLCESV